MAENLNKIIIATGGKEYEFSGGGGQPGPDTVGTSEIIDGSVQTEDLSDEVKEKTRSTYNAETEGIKLGGL